MRDFIQEEWFNCFPKLIISYRTDVYVSKIILFGPKQEIYAVSSLFIICDFSVSTFLFQVLIRQSRSSHDCLIKFFARAGRCLFKTSIKMFKKCSNSKLHTSSFDSS